MPTLEQFLLGGIAVTAAVMFIAGVVVGVFRMSHGKGWKDRP